MGILRFFHRRTEDTDLEQELQAHISHQIDENRAAGMTQDEARRLAYLKLGSPRRVRETVWQWNSLEFLESLLKDFRLAFRRLRSNPGFAAASILTLALGIGATTAIFSAIYPILFASLPYSHPRQILMIWEMRTDGRPQQPAFATFYGLEERSHPLAYIAALKPWQPTMTGPDQPERFEGQSVGPYYFRVLAVAPMIGRDFQPQDDLRNSANVTILSHGLWQRRFGGDRGVVGKQITLDGKVYTVIGVMPPTFENVLSPSAELWSPLQYDMSQGRAWGHHLRIVGRLASGVSQEQAMRELDAQMQSILKTYAAGYATSGGPPKTLTVKPLQEDLIEAIRPSLLAILGAVLLVLVIACVNVTNLLLARGAQRRGEFAMRIALGAERMRLVRQMLTESLLIAFAGGALGIEVAILGVRSLVALSPPGLPRAGAIEVNGAVLAFALVITTAIGLAIGLIPALNVSRSGVQAVIQQSSQRTAGGHQWTRNFLVVSEVAFALVLLVSAGLLWRSLERLFSVPTGFSSANVLTMQVQTAGHRFDDDNTTRLFFRRALAAVRSVPGVQAAGFTSQLPLSGDFDVYGMNLEPRPGTPAGKFAVLRYAVSPGYCETMRIPLMRGRLFDEHDVNGAPAVALVSESFARREFAGSDPLGHRMHVGPTESWFTIVGVVGDVKQTSLALDQMDAVYIPSTQWRWADGMLSLVVRGQNGNAAALAPSIRTAIWGIDKDQPIVRLATMDSLLAKSEAGRHFALILFQNFALAALLLAAIGIYGVLAGSVTERMREIGVRSALGASRSDILAMILRQGLKLTGTGIVIGLAGATIASEALVTLLFGISRLDPVTYLGVIALLLGVSVVACWVPAWRAARIDPAITLRSE